VVLGVLKSRQQRCAITTVLLMAGNAHIAPAGQDVRSAVGGTVIDNENVRAAMPPHFVEDSIDMCGFVIDGQSDQPAATHLLFPWCE
jgi:hypothetical protein